MRRTTVHTKYTRIRGRIALSVRTLGTRMESVRQRNHYPMAYVTFCGHAKRYPPDGPSARRWHYRST